MTMYLSLCVRRIIGAAVDYADLACADTSASDSAAMPGAAAASG